MKRGRGRETQREVRVRDKQREEENNGEREAEEGVGRGMRVSRPNRCQRDKVFTMFKRMSSEGPLSMRHL